MVDHGMRMNQPEESGSVLHALCSCRTHAMNELESYDCRSEAARSTRDAPGTVTRQVQSNWKMEIDRPVTTRPPAHQQLYCTMMLLTSAAGFGVIKPTTPTF